MKPTPIATPVKAFEAIAPATNLKPITNLFLMVSGCYTGFIALLLSNEN